MEKISDTITTVFHIDIKDNRPAICSSGDGRTIWSDTFGLGWRFGIAYNQKEWFAMVRLYLDHNQSQTERDGATVTVSLRDSTNKDAKARGERVTTITEFGHGEPALLGSWSPYDFTLYPYVSFTVTTKARPPKLISSPLSSTSLALRHSLASGDFVDTKFYVFSVKRPGSTAGKPRVVYGNDKSIGLVVPKSTLGKDGVPLLLHLELIPIAGAKQSNESAPKFLVNMTSDHQINGDSVLHEYEYEQDSDLDDEEEDDSDDIGLQRNPVPGKFQTGSSSKPHTSSEFLLLPMFLVNGRCYQRARHKEASMAVCRKNHLRTPSVPVA